MVFLIAKGVDNAIHKYSKFAVESNDGLATENIIILNSKTGKLVSNTKTGDFDGKLVIPKADVNSLILVHNHLNNTSLSIEDIITLNVAPEIKTIIAVAHDGKVYKLSIGNGVRISEKEMRFLNLEWQRLCKKYSMNTDTCNRILRKKYNWMYREL